VPSLPAEPCLHDVPPVMIEPVLQPVAVPVASEARLAVQRFQAQLADLAAMGFTNRALCEHFLQQTGGNLEATIDWLQADDATGGEVRRSLERARGGQA